MKSRFSPLRLAATAALVLAGLVAAPASADNKATPAFETFQKTFAAVSDYQDQIVAHETTDDGKSVQDRTYQYKWKRPTYAQILIIDGPGKGSGAAWKGGTTISGHKGGWLSGIHQNIDIHDPRATSLRGDTLEVASFEWQIKHYLGTPGTMSEAAGPAIEGQATTAVTLVVTDPKANASVSKDVLYIGKDKHLPVRREQFVGATLVKTETFKDVKLDNGFTPDDFK